LIIAIVVGAAFALVGAGDLAEAKSAIHQILGAINLGFGALIAAAGAVGIVLRGEIQAAAGQIERAIRR
jgi:hypothetical protein